ncbi:hypothetical protein [Reyranella sp.]|uniref:hypothetical protein n=1 Tax=Reyranella sp. TaxID=1929291 RepID=UPI003D0F01EE
MLLLGTAALALVPAAARAQGVLDAGGMTFRDFAVADRGSSFNKIDPMIGSGAVPTQARILSIDNDGGFARIRFDAIRIEVAMPLGWQANEDWERGVGFSSDKRFRLIVWRVDFAYEGVNDAEHYAATKTGAIKARKPGIQAQARKLSDGSFLIVYQNVPAAPGDAETRVVFDLVVPRPGKPKEGALMTLGVAARDSDHGLKLMALLKSKLKVDW